MAEINEDLAPFAGLAPGRHGRADGTAGVTLAPITGGATVLVALPGADRPAASAALEARFGTPLPAAGRVTEKGGVAVLWAGAGRWLVTAESLPSGILVTELARVLGPGAALVDQTDGRVSFRLTGPKVTDTLAKLVGLDLDLSAFAVETTAVTALAHVTAQLWRIAPDAFDVSVPRSFIGSVLEAVAEAAAEHGLDRVGPIREIAFG